MALVCVLDRKSYENDYNIHAITCTTHTPTNHRVRTLSLYILTKVCNVH